MLVTVPGAGAIAVKKADKHTCPGSADMPTGGEIIKKKSIQ